MPSSPSSPSSPRAPSSIETKVLSRVDETMEELLEFLQRLVHIPTINPPGDNYTECAQLVGGKLHEFGYEVSYIEAEGLAECTREHPRTNVIGRMPGTERHPVLHFNGHLDVVPPGGGWSLDPFAAIVREGRIYGRGVTDQKAGIAASIFAVEAIRRSGIRLAGTIEQSATVDEESGGQAGVAFLAEKGFFSHKSIDYVIITEPLNHDRICLGHRGVYWFELAVQGRIAHGSMPFLGASAIDRMARVIERIERELKPRLAARRTRMPVEPPEARSASINVNAIAGGQPIDGLQTPCVADLCRAIFDRRFLLEESLDDVRSEIIDCLEGARRDDHELSYELRDTMIVHPTLTSAASPLVTEMSRAVKEMTACTPALIASPGTYDQKHFARIAGIDQCIAYGPGILSQAHQPDEYCEIEHIRIAAKAMALASLRLLGVASAHL
ncbi:MAG: acetylornithine deacetylase/succinyl-diaminopimelate desuccinylase family protein [Acidobacteriota bacterium]